MNISLFTRRYPYVLLCGVGVIALVVWEFLGRVGLIREYTWSYPTQIASALWHDLTTPGNEQGDQNVRRTLIPHIGLTLLRFSLGFLAASVLGVVVGFLLGVSKSFQAVGHPVVNVLRSLPSAAVWPVCAATLGYGTSSQMFVVVFGATWPILVYTMKGVGALRHEVHDSLQFMWLEWYRRWWVLFLWSLPSIVTGLEVGCAIAFLLTVTVEFFYPASGGLGWYLDYYRQAGTEADRLFAGLFLIGLLGWASNTCVHLLRRKLVFWEGDFQTILRQKAPKRMTRVIAKIKDDRRRRILVTHYVTKEIEALYHLVVQPTVLYQGVPYMFPDEVRTELGQAPFCSGITQRDIAISVPSEDANRMKVILFARSWIVESALAAASLEKLNEKKLTIGTIVRKYESGCTYEHLWYREQISHKLGSVFAAGGTVELIQRARLIVINARPAIFIEEFVPV